MSTPLEQKSTPDGIRRRFDNDVARFSNLETGQTAIVDAVLTMELIMRAAVASTPTMRRVLDVGCGAGNNTLKLLQMVSPLDCDLLDLSAPMLRRAQERVAAVNPGRTRTFQGDLRTVDLPEEGYDVILAGAVLHHLRDDRDWETAFHKLFRLTAPGGSLWITDLVAQETAPVQEMMLADYAAYLVSLDGEAYRDQIMATIDREDSPRPLSYQLDLLRRAGYARVEILHKRSCFAAFGGLRSA